MVARKTRTLEKKVRWIQIGNNSIALAIKLCCNAGKRNATGSSIRAET